MDLRSFLLCLALTSLCRGTSVSIVKVPTTTGILHGKSTSALEKPLMQFLGVPYAKAPVGDLRFRPPVEMVADTVARDAAAYAASCYQPPHMKSVISPLLTPNQAEISEDCLYLNIFVPEVHPDEKPLPVMVWLPGEGFDYADPQQFDGSYLAVLGKVIVVTVNYRVSIFGFLSTLSDDAPGNVGLLDQRMALKWLKKNIAKFGGDADNVTLFGRFSGAMSVGIHAFSPLNQQERLFNRVILQSGVPVGDWVFDKNPLNSTFLLAEATNCLLSEVSDTVACMRRIPADILLQKALAVPNRWRPIFDYHLAYEDALMAASKMSDNPIDFMLGINNNEGSLCTIVLNAMGDPLYKKLVKDQLTDSELKELVDNNMKEIFKKTDALTSKMAFHEYSSSDRQSLLRKSFIGFCGDIYITSHMQKLADLLASNNRGRVYMYEFAHRPTFSIHPNFIEAGHGDDVLFTLGLPFKLPELRQDEVKLTRRTVEAITNFARRGNPNRPGLSSEADWPQYTVASRQIMTFTNSTQREPEAVRRSSHDRAVSFWHDVIPAAQHRACPVAGAVGDGLGSCPECGAPERPHSVLGGVLTIPSAEYLVLGLFCTAVFLLLTSLAAVILVFRGKRHVEFERLK